MGKKGVRPPAAGMGRKAGVPNKITRSVREAFQAAFEELQKHQGVNLADWGVRNPTDFYKLASKLIPIATELSGKDGGPIQFSETEAAAKLASILEAAKARKISEPK